MTEGPNAGQWQVWDGAAGAFWTEHADRFDRAVAGYDPHLEAAAAVVAGERVLDVGCGTGATTRAAARRAGPDGHALGLDLSARMLELARARAAAERLDTVTFTRADAQVHPFPPGGVDVVLSRHGVMFFDDPPAAFANLARALRPGGRLAVLVWQGLEGNHFIHRVLNAMTPDRDTPYPPADGRPSPLSLADPARVHALLDAAGFVDVHLEGVEEPMVFGDDPEEAFAYQIGHQAWLLAELDPATRERAHARLRDDLAAHHEPGAGVRYPSAAWLVTARTPE
ncbi:methyltransferase domain-containing protein [Actinomycetospora sp. TBRC 11914]|uniref:methyltransferase domain-containing protein n=1 Tax=Actinomycetospora sp. TBRC 11914 TaxID=2729387 RepID=UPI00145D899B|nr:methyltransferase domain-containing protein [Actinomycetospora sp. TBRC 11914]NMO89739.1 methyltransferase domain-containing protein [Actinomycetospora sp. TBRC 11914]